MKRPVIIILFSLCVSIFPLFSYADTCPPVHQFTPQVPPGGWSMLVPAIFPGTDYRFVSATHSINPTFYKFQVICSYECLSKDDKNCSSFSLISNALYQLPQKNKAPWNAPLNMVNTVVCQPLDNNPLECIFSN